MGDVLQNALIERYVNSLGLMTVQDVGTATFVEWRKLIDTLFDQALILNRKEWVNPTELKECSKNNEIWETIRKIYDEMIGTVNGVFLQRNTELVCLVVAYAVKKRPISDEKLSTKESFRLKIEYFLAREILTQRKKSIKTIEDELTDRKYIRSLRKRNVCKFQLSNGENREKIDFSQITPEGYKKVCAISCSPIQCRNLVDSNDEDLADNYILFSFGQVGSDVYARSWAHVLIGLGLKPTNKGIEFLANRIDAKMQDVMYECLITQHIISPTSVIKARFCQELYKILKEILDEKQISKPIEQQDPWDENSILYIYKNRTSCHTRKHEFISATAILTGRNNSQIKLNVEYCTQCKKFFMSYTVYESYREKYGMLLGKLRMDSASVTEFADIVLSECSPLKLCGYSVSQQVGYSTQERQYIISKVIELGVLQKSEVIRYLEYFINMNGRKTGNEVALSKWKQDLEFALKYKLSEQREYEIRHIKKY